MKVLWEAFPGYGKHIKKLYIFAVLNRIITQI